MAGTAPTVAEISWLEGLMERFFPRRIPHPRLVPVESPWFAARRPVAALPPPIELPQLPPPGPSGFPWFG